MSNDTFNNRPLKERREFVRQITQRMVQAYRVNGTEDLAEIFEMSHGAVKNWRSQARMPLDPMFKCHLETGVTMDWLMYGKPPQIVIDETRRDDLKSHFREELDVGVRFKLINSQREDGLDVLANAMTDGMVKFMDITITGAAKVSNSGDD